VTLDRAFAELRPAMFALAYRITGNRADAEEIVQDAFVRMHDAAPKEAVRSLKAYLATITARLSLNACAINVRAAKPISANGCPNRS
jgi:RNA polymerase sigma-70 factor, ECF subfamily